ncbi:MAG: tetratricopeptide repeat protein [Myxococcota bacterium]
MAWGKGDAGEETDRALRRSLRAAVAGDWATAETWLERIVEANSKDLDAYQALARLYREQGSIGRAIRMHQNLILRSDVPRASRDEALLELARDFDEGGFRERAISAYEEVLSAKPREALALERLSVLLRETQDVPRALAVLKKFRRRDKDKANALEAKVHLDHAQACAATGDDDGARAALKKCLKRDPACGDAWAMLGELEAERGKTARALDAWKKAVASSPENAEAIYPKIDASFAAKGKPDGFIAYLRDVLKEDPSRHSARVILARALSSKGDAREAVEELARAIEVMPDATELHAELGRQLLASGQEGEALKAYAKLVDVLGGDAGRGSSAAAAEAEEGAS